MKKNLKKLRLSRETLRGLDTVQATGTLRVARGGELFCAKTSAEIIPIDPPPNPTTPVTQCRPCA